MTSLDAAEKIKVFISSIQNKEVEDLEPERTAAIAAIQGYSPTRAWAFEYTPASDLSAEEYYLRGVRECHLFLVVLGGEVVKVLLSRENVAFIVQRICHPLS